MGRKYIFKCPNCKYETEVGGGKDGGLLIIVETMICDNCNELVDVLLGKRKVWKGVWKGEITDEITDVKIRKCPKCGSNKVKLWRKKHPCPKCGSTMKQGKLTLLWH